MKGMSLPIETIVVVAIAVLVLVVLVAMFVPGMWRQSDYISDSVALASGCQNLLNSLGSCTTPVESITIFNYNTTCGGSKGNTLKIACCRNGFTDTTYGNPQACQHAACKCPIP